MAYRRQFNVTGLQGNRAVLEAAFGDDGVPFVVDSWTAAEIYEALALLRQRPTSRARRKGIELLESILGQAGAL